MVNEVDRLYIPGLTIEKSSPERGILSAQEAKQERENNILFYCWLTSQWVAVIPPYSRGFPT